MIQRRDCWMVVTVAAACALVFAVPVASADTRVWVGFEPQNVSFDQPVTVTFTGTTDGPKKLYAYYYSSYRAYSVCSGADPRYHGVLPNVLDGVPVVGFFSIPIVVTVPSDDDISNGAYRVCAWLAAPGSETAVGEPEKIEFQVHRPSEPKPTDTWLRATFHLRAEDRKLVVTSQIVAFSGGPPGGSCVLEVFSAQTWLYATPQAQIDGRGRCRLALEAPHLRRRFRVRFIPAAGFRASIGAPTWVEATTRP